MNKNRDINKYTLVMAGGRGTRFWPESTTARPKQYLKLTSDKSLLEETLGRFEGLVEREKRFVVTVKEQEKLAAECSSGAINDKGLIFEPAGRNTAPCILLSLATLLEQGASEDDIIIVVPSDHVIINQDEYRKTMRKACEAADQYNEIVVIGIMPHCPQTAFGYIQKGEEKADGVFAVEGFKEKPNLNTAKEYLASGNYLWNAGMFVGKIKVFLEEFAEHAKEMHQYFGPLKAALGNSAELNNVYNLLPQDSIDYAIMEKSKRVSVVPASFDWNDLGSWDALEEVIPLEQENTLASVRSFYGDNARGNIIYAPGKFVSAVNIDDHIIVVSGDCVIVLPKKDSQKVKEIVSHLKEDDSLTDLL